MVTFASGRADRVAEGDRAAVHVDLREVRAELLLPGEHDRGERLVDLDERDVVELHARLVERVARRRDRCGQHVHRVVGPHAQVVDARARLEPVLLHRALRRDEERRGAVGDLAREGRGDAASRLERLELRHLLETRVAPRALVVTDATERRDLLLEAALVDGAQRAPVALEREGLHVLARDAPLLGDHLGAAELGDLLRPVPGRPALRAREGALEAHRLRERHGRRDRDHAHVLDAAGDDEVRGAAHHRLGGEVHRLLRGAALAVDRHARHVLGEAGREPAGARDVARLRPDRVAAAEHHVLDRRGVDPRPVHERTQHVRPEIRRVHLREPAAAPPHRAPHRIHDVRLCHVASPPC
jgi:hypothetical protein